MSNDKKENPFTATIDRKLRDKFESHPYYTNEYDYLRQRLSVKILMVAFMALTVAFIV